MSLVAKFVKWLQKGITCECGNGMVEYALLAALLACGTTAGERGIALGVTSAYSQISSNLDSAMGAASAGSKGNGTKGNKGNKGNNGNKGNKGGKKNKG